MRPHPPADPNAPPRTAAPEPGRVDNAAGGLSFVVPAGWQVSDATQLSYGQALLTKIAPEGGQAPNDTSVLLGRLDLKLFAGAETDNTKAAQRLASDMGEFFMPFPGTRINQQTATLNANGMPGVASYYEVKFTDTNKPNGQIWAGVVGSPAEPGTPRGQRDPGTLVRRLAGHREQPDPAPRGDHARQLDPAIHGAASAAPAAGRPERTAGSQCTAARSECATAGSECACTAARRRSGCSGRSEHSPGDAASPLRERASRASGFFAGGLWRRCSPCP